MTEIHKPRVRDSISNILTFLKKQNEVSNKCVTLMNVGEKVGIFGYSDL